jgi:type IV pilus assembly protein PilA
VITATAKGTGNTTIDNQTITLTGVLAANGQVDWTCAGTIPAKYRPSSCK